MELRTWLTHSNTSIKAFARAVNVERAMIYRYFLGTVPRARVIHRIETLTGGAVTAQDFHANAVRRMDGLAVAMPPPEIPAAMPEMSVGAFAPMPMDQARA